MILLTQLVASIFGLLRTLLICWAVLFGTWIIALALAPEIMIPLLAGMVEGLEDS